MVQWPHMLLVIACWILPHLHEITVSVVHILMDRVAAHPQPCPTDYTLAHPHLSLDTNRTAFSILVSMYIIPILPQHIVVILSVVERARRTTHPATAISRAEYKHLSTSTTLKLHSAKSHLTIQQSNSPFVVYRTTI